MKGKSKCKILKDIRRQIAAENHIEYVTSECKYQGDCSGTCPKCEAEVRYLEAELEKRRKAGKAIAVAGIAAALTMNLPGCAFRQTTTDGDVASPSSESTTQATQVEIDGDIVYTTESTDTQYVTQGVIVEPPETTESVPIPGEVPEESTDVPGGLIPETQEETEDMLLMGVLPEEDMSKPLIPFESISALPPETEQTVPPLMGEPVW